MRDKDMRAAGLPDFKNPPLTEVVLSGQFRPLENYKGTDAFEVWSLFKGEFGLIEEQPPIPQQFETFGRAGQVSNLEFVRGPVHSRYWFLTEDRAELLQFQPDRFTQNWRKIESAERPYPRFEAMIERFFENLGKLRAFADSRGLGVLEPNQCEVSYINHLPATSDEGGSIPASFYVSLLAADAKVVSDDLRCIFRKEIRNDGEEAIGRFIIEIASAWTPEGQSIYRLTLVARGAPPTPDDEGCRAFMESSRLGIAEIFLDITTNEAQQLWGRVA